MDQSERQHILDEEHLRLLRIGYFIQGGLTLLMCFFGLFYVFVGLFVFSRANVPSTPGAPSPEFVGYIFAAFGGLFVLGGAVFATLQFFTARSLRQRGGRTLCLIAAALTCIFIPYGTALGIWTFLVLSRPSVRALFNGAAPQPTA